MQWNVVRATVLFSTIIQTDIPNDCYSFLLCSLLRSSLAFSFSLSIVSVVLLVNSDSRAPSSNHPHIIHSIYVFCHAKHSNGPMHFRSATVYQLENERYRICIIRMMKLNAQKSKRKIRPFHVIWKMSRKWCLNLPWIHQQNEWNEKEKNNTTYSYSTSSNEEKNRFLYNLNDVQVNIQKDIVERESRREAKI